MTPVFQNTQFEEESYHGYGIQNFLEIDPRFGTEQGLTFAGMAIVIGA